MKYEYKVIEVSNPSKAEAIMNDMSKKGWRVISVVLWHNVLVKLVITFEKEVVG
jgi:hypothetical protein